MYRKTFTYRGKRYDIKADTQEELLEKVAERKYMLSRGEEKESAIRVKAYADKWLRIFKQPYVSKTTYIMYKGSLKHINKYIGTMKMRDVTSADIQELVTGEYTKGYSKSHINKIILTVRQVFKQAYVDGEINKNPTLTIRRPNQDDGNIRALTEDEYKAIVDVAQTHRYGLWILTMLYTGMRPSETARLRYQDITEETIHIRGTKSKKADRFVPMPNPLKGKFKGSQGYVFTTGEGNAPDNHTRQRWWRAFKRDLDIHMGAETYRNKITKSVLSDTLVMYCLRHNYGTMAHKAGVPIDVLADLMGHEKIDVTRKYYIDDNLESKRRVMEQLNGMWK